MTEPHKTEDMLSRVRTALRRRSLGLVKSPLKTVTIGPLTLDTVTGRASLNGTDLLLEPKAFAILRLLAINEGNWVPVEKLYLTAWKKPMFNDCSALRTQISRLKKKLAPEKCLVLLFSRDEGAVLQLLL
mgnify:CR=1 FL=1